MEFLDNDLRFEEEIQLRVIIIGKVKIGKSFFCNRINLNYSKYQKLNLHYIQTVAVEFYKILIKLRNKIFNLQIWDTSGEEIYKDIKTNFYEKSKIFLMFYDASDRDSFEIAKSDLKEIRKKCNIQNPIVLLVRSKYDNILKTKKDDIVSDEEAIEFVDKNKIYFFHIGINEKFETGINELFEFALNKYIEEKYV